MPSQTQDIQQLAFIVVAKTTKKASQAPKSYEDILASEGIEKVGL